MTKKIYAKEWASCIIDCFEDFLDERGVSLENEDKINDQSAAIIYGEDFDDLLSSLINIISEMCDCVDIDVDVNNFTDGSQIEYGLFKKIQKYRYEYGYTINNELAEELCLNDASEIWKIVDKYDNAKYITPEQVVELWETKPLAIEWDDGTTSMCQDNDYGVDKVLEYMSYGNRVFIDE